MWAVCVCVCACVHMCVCVFMCVCLCACVRMCVCVCVCVCVFMCVCVVCVAGTCTCVCFGVQCRYMLYGLLFLPCIQKMAVSIQFVHLAGTSNICMHVCHLCVGYVLMYVFSNKAPSFVDNHFVSFSHP